LIQPNQVQSFFDEHMAQLHRQLIPIHLDH
jgi:hypothetical protein